MTKEETKKLAYAIDHESPDFRVVMVLKLDSGEYALEIEDKSIKKTFTMMNEKDWFILKSKKRTGTGPYNPKKRFQNVV